MLLPYEGIQAGQKEALPNSFFEEQGATDCFEPRESMLVHLYFCLAKSSCVVALL